MNEDTYDKMNPDDMAGLAHEQVSNLGTVNEINGAYNDYNADDNNNKDEDGGLYKCRQQ